ncbi:MAG: hypothetical protein Tsb0013_22390 [Phycisphaerales bacterium]
MTHTTITLALLVFFALAAGCAQQRTSANQPPRWALAIHGGAGFIDPGIPDDQRAAYEAGLREALQHGADRLANGDRAIEVVESVTRILEDNPLFNAGRGGVFAADGTVRHDASIMDGRDRSCGATTGTMTVKHPITLARHVMTDTRFVFLSGEGAERFADQTGVERVPNTYFHTEARRADLERRLQRERANQQSQGPGTWGELGSTVGCVALDMNGDLAAATSTGGLTAKKWGRIGDSPVIGAGTYADNRTCALSGTGEGEQYIRHAICHEVHALMLHKGMSLEEACRVAMFEILKPEDGGIIGVSATGELVTMMNTPSMTRGRADSNGLFQVAIWED